MIKKKIVIESFSNTFLKSIYSFLCQLFKMRYTCPTIRGRGSYTNFKWAWEDIEFKLLVPIAFNKNG